jgi:hypothetical protein
VRRHRYGARRAWKFLRSSLVESPWLALSTSASTYTWTYLLGRSHKAWMLPDTLLFTPAPLTPVLCTPLLSYLRTRPRSPPRTSQVDVSNHFRLTRCACSCAQSSRLQRASHAVKEPASQLSRATLHCSPRRLHLLPQTSHLTTFTSPRPCTLTSRCRIQRFWWLPYNRVTLTHLTSVSQRHPSLLSFPYLAQTCGMNFGFKNDTSHWPVGQEHINR